MVDVLSALDKIILETAAAGDIHETSPRARTNSNVSTTRLPGKGYSCLASFADYGEVRRLVAAFAHDLEEMPFLNCFGHDNTTHQEKIPLQRSELVVTMEPETNEARFARPEHQLREQNLSSNLLRHPHLQHDTFIEQ